MKAFEIKGTMDINRNKQVFSIQIAAEDAESAKMHILSELGSRHRLKRPKIDIAEIKELKGDDVTDKITRHKVGLK